jgi:serine/threonine protein kinase
LSGKYSREFFNKRGRFNKSENFKYKFYLKKFILGELLHISNLRPWDLYSVLTQKYSWPIKDARNFADFLTPMLAYDTKRRATALDCLKHSWILHEIDSSYDPKRKANKNNEDSTSNNQSSNRDNKSEKEFISKTEYNSEKKAESKKSDSFHFDSKPKKYLDLVKKINDTEDSSNDIINLEKYKSPIDNANADNSS